MYLEGGGAIWEQQKNIDPMLHGAFRQWVLLWSEWRGTHSTDNDIFKFILCKNTSFEANQKQRKAHTHSTPLY